MRVRHLLLAHSPTGGGVNSSPWRCPSFHFSTIFPSPLHHLCSGFWQVVHRCSSFGMQLSWPCILGSRTQLKCQDSHRNLESKLLLDDDTWGNVGEKRCLIFYRVQFLPSRILKNKIQLLKYIKTKNFFEILSVQCCVSAYLA